MDGKMDHFFHSKLCTDCKKQPVYIKKRGLCRSCYQRWRRQHGRVFTVDNKPKTKRILEIINHASELEFVKNYFKHTNWLYQPAHFKANGTSYTPDFYDVSRGVFIELVGSRQGYDQRKKKIEWLKQTFPKISLEVRTPDGSLIKEMTNGCVDWPKPEQRKYF